MPSESASTEEIFGQALSKGDAAARAAYLDQVCANDPALRQRLNALLAAHDAAANFLKLPDPDHARITESPGSKIGRYKLLEQIGEGGFGVVFMARQEEPVRRTVALKIIKLGMDTRQVIARFEAERQALAMMDHPNIAKVLDAGSTDTGRPYFVMELVKGIPLTTYCDHHNLSIIQRLELFIPVCHAIQHAHQKGIIHRDLKPSNVLVTRHDDRPVPMVIDFGVAKATQNKLTEKTLFTGFRQLIGTPSYMSPEQAQFGGIDIDTRSDIYSLGALLYELLAGSPPFEPDALRTKAFEEMQRMIREVEPAQPSTRLSTLAADTQTLRATERQSDPKRLAHMMRGELDWIVMRCLEKDRTRRYETANALAEDLQRYLKDEPVQARRATRMYRMRKFARRNKIPVFAATAIFIALAAGIVVASVGFFQARRQAEIARTEAIRSKQVSQFLKSMLDGVNPSVALGRDTTLLREILDIAGHRVADDLKNRPELEAELRSFIGKAYFDINDYSAAEAMQRQALALRRTTLGNSHPDVAASLHALGLVLCIRDQPHPRYKEAESVFREALTIRRKVFGEINADVASTLFDLGLCLWREQDPALYPEAETLQRQAIAIHEKLGHQNTYAITSPQQGLGLVLMSQGQYPEAEKLFRTTLDQRRKLLAHDDPHLTYPMGNVASILYVQRRDLPEAEALARESLAIRRKSERKDHKDVAEEVELLADILAAQSNWAEAEPLYRERIEWQRKFRTDNAAELAALLDRLANVLEQRGALDESRRLRGQSATLQITPSSASQP